MYLQIAYIPQDTQSLSKALVLYHLQFLNVARGSSEGEFEARTPARVSRDFAENLGELSEEPVVGSVADMFKELFFPLE